MLKGVAASSGIAIGKAYVIKENQKEIKRYEVKDVEKEINRFHEAILKAKEEIEEIKEKAVKDFGEDRALIFEAHLMILEDEEFKASVLEKIKQNTNAEYAVKEAVEMFEGIFLSMDDEYMRERAADIRDIGGRIIRILKGEDKSSIRDIKDKCIVVAKDLTPSDTAQLNKEYVLGFVTELGGKTSHSAIIARALEIPAVSGIKDATEILKTGDLLILDGANGFVYINADENLLREYEIKIQREIEEKRELLIYKDKKAVTKDGKRIEIAANISSKEEVDVAI